MYNDKKKIKEVFKKELEKVRFYSESIQGD